jgi:hypothetical protein
MDIRLIKALRYRIANTSIDAATARNMGPKGTVSAARNYLAGLNLMNFKKKNIKAFRRSLNRATIRFIKFLPQGSKHWGSARKFLNIFLRNTVYNRFLCRHYDLNCIKQWLEVPLDSHVAKGLITEVDSKLLPRWKTVIGLDQRISQLYQDFALKVAKKKGIHRVDLDLLYWRREI